MSLFVKYAPLNYASIGGTPEAIGPKGESVEQFEIMEFFERRNNFIRFLQISTKEICAINLRIDWCYSGNDWSYG